MEEDHSVSNVVTYLLERVSQLSDRNARLEADLANVKELRGTEGAENGNGHGFEGRNGESFEEENHVAKQVVKTAMEVSKALMDRSRLDLDIAGLLFLSAIRRNKIEDVREKVQQNMELLTMRSLKQETYSYTALHIAADEGKTEICQALIDLGADVYATDLTGKTPLHVAASKLHNDVVRLLMSVMGSVCGEDAPADINGVTPAGYSALSTKIHPAIANKRTDTPVRRSEALSLLHKKGDACISPLSRTKNKKSRVKSRLANETVILPDAVSRKELKFGSASIPGYRVAMEDALCVGTKLGPMKNLSLFAAFDGHGGSTAADFCAKNICQSFSRKMDEALDVGRDVIAQALRLSVLELEAEMRESSRFQLYEEVTVPAMNDEPAKTRRRAQDTSGTTATIAVTSPSHVVVANVGDSRTIIFDDENVVFSTRDHCEPEDAEHDEFWRGERERIERAGGKIKGKRIYFDENENRHLAMSRALGDFEYKQGSPETVIIAEPEIFTIPRRPHAGPRYVLLACDGIWDVVSNEACRERVLGSLDEIKVSNNSPADILDQVCEHLALSCIDSNDNISLILVDVSTTQDALYHDKEGEEDDEEKILPIQRNLAFELDQAVSLV